MKQSASNSQHLASLSGLGLTDSEMQSIGGDLDSIINYITMLDELDVSDVEPTYQVINTQNVWREDEIDMGSLSKEQLLDLSHSVRDGQVEVPKVL